MASVAYFLVVCIITCYLGPSEGCPCEVQEEGTLDCQGLKLTRVPSDCRSDGITKIDLADNMLTELQPYQFSNFSHLKNIDLSNNKLTDFPQFATKNITILSLQDNRIQRIEKHHIEGFTRLLDLHLGGNRISYIENYTFVDACHLLLLSLRDNPLKAIGKAGFVGTALEILDIRNTLLEYLPTEGLQGLQRLRATDTVLLKAFPSHSSLPSIRVLTLTYESHCCLYLGKETQIELPTCGPTVETAKENDLWERRSSAAREPGACPSPRATPCETPTNAHVNYYPRCSPLSLTIGGHRIPACSEYDNTTATPPLVTLPPFKVDHNVTVISNVSIICTPEPNDADSCDDLDSSNALNPSENVTRNWLLRILVWLVMVLI
jgi:hypothetical protein